MIILLLHKDCSLPGMIANTWLHQLLKESQVDSDVYCHWSDVGDMRQNPLLLLLLLLLLLRFLELHAVSPKPHKTASSSC
jgi:hypothetical protein